MFLSFPLHPLYYFSPVGPGPRLKKFQPGLDIEEGTEGTESNDEEEYYSDYGEETDEQLQKDLPDATGWLNFFLFISQMSQQKI